MSGGIYNGFIFFFDWFRCGRDLVLVKSSWEVFIGIFLGRLIIFMDVMRLYMVFVMDLFNFGIDLLFWNVW